MNKFILLFFLFTSISLTNCKDEAVYTPKPRAFPRVIYPEKEYQQFDEKYCHFTFEYPKYAVISQDTNFFDKKPLNDCWFDINIPTLSGEIHCSYYPIHSKKDFEKFVNDAHELANKHNIRANYIDELKIQKDNHVSGFVFDIDGAAASPMQFYLTDSTHHFMRGSLYFKTQSRPDSLAPVVDFVKKDIMQMINTFKWIQ